MTSTNRAATNGAPLERSYFEQQREALVNEIAVVSHDQHTLTCSRCYDAHRS